LRALDLGFIDPCSDKVALAVPRRLAHRARVMLQSLELHDIHNRLAGQPAHYARDASLHAGLDPAALRGALRVHREGNRAKHQWQARPLEVPAAAEAVPLRLSALLSLPSEGGSSATSSRSTSSSAPSLGLWPASWLCQGCHVPVRAEVLREPLRAERLPAPQPGSAGVSGGGGGDAFPGLAEGDRHAHVCTGPPAHGVEQQALPPPAAALEVVRLEVERLERSAGVCSACEVSAARPMAQQFLSYGQPGHMQVGTQDLVSELSLKEASADSQLDQLPRSPDDSKAAPCQACLRSWRFGGRECLQCARERQFESETKAKERFRRFGF